MASGSGERKYGGRAVQTRDGREYSRRWNITPPGNAVKNFCSRIRENSHDSMTPQKSYDFCYVRLSLFCSSEIINGVAYRAGPGGLYTTDQGQQK